MESTNLHHHRQENLSHLGSSSSSSSQAAATSYYGVEIEHAWTQQQLNTTTASNLSNPSSLSLHNSSSYINLPPDLGFHCSWPLITETLTGAGSSTTSSMKEELSSSSTGSTFPKFTQMLTTPSSINLDDDDDYHNPTTHHHNHDAKFYNSNNNHFQNFTQLMPGISLNFSHIYPSINVSNLNQQPSPTSSRSSIDMNLQAMDLLASSRFRTTTHEPSNSSHETLGIYNTEVSHNSFGNNELTEVKRTADSLIEPKTTQAAASKKSRLESRTSCPALKVRKEKLGDRISTLQQLVAPFGKTDTASVLMEAIGYINFLHNQIETLSVPYMKSSSRHNKSSQALLQPGMVEMNGSNGDHERKRDLRSRGLCLVPLSCMSSVTDGAEVATVAGGVTGSVNFWPGHNYGLGGT